MAWGPYTAFWLLPEAPAYGIKATILFPRDTFNKLQHSNTSCSTKDLQTDSKEKKAGKERRKK